MADKLGLGPEVKELRLGSSFTNKGSAFHTFRYDFKPASVDTSKMATVDILPNNEVTVTVPHTCDGNGVAQTSVFRGPKKPYAKECVLIIDHNTGEITLERLSHNIQLKKTRAEGSSKIARPPSPVDPVIPSIQQSYSQKKPSPVRKSPPASSSPKQVAPSPPYRNTMETHQHKTSPKHGAGYAGNRSRNVVSSPSRQPANHQSSQSSMGFSSLPGSMPLICDLDGAIAPSSSVVTHQEEATAIVGVLSDSSDSESGSDSSSNSSESDSDSDEMDTTPIPVAQTSNGRNGNSGSSNGLPSSISSSGRESMSLSSSTLPQLSMPTHFSMPTHLLSEDLQLSDSGSDSD